VFHPRCYGGVGVRLDGNDQGTDCCWWAARSAAGAAGARVFSPSLVQAKSLNGRCRFLCVSWTGSAWPFMFPVPRATTGVTEALPSLAICPDGLHRNLG